MPEEILIRITNDNLPLLRYEDNGKIIENYITPESLLLTLSKYVEENALFKTPALPKGTVHYQLTTGGCFLVVEVDPVCVPVRYFKATVESVPFPKLLFGFSIQDNHVGEVYIVAAKDEQIVETTQLFYYPYSNVSENKACWSELPIRMNSLADVTQIPAMWFGSENTDCYFNSNTRSKMKYYDYLRHNANRGEFDFGTLKPLGKTFGEWTESPKNKD